MIIQCEQCSTKFRLDDSRVTDKGVKVRCARCRHVFTVSKEQSGSPPADFGSVLSAAAASHELPAHAPETMAEQPDQMPDQPPVDSSPFGADFAQEEFAEAGLASSEPFGTQEENIHPSSVNDDMDFSIPGEEHATIPGEKETAANGLDSFDFGGFNAESASSFSSTDFDFSIHPEVQPPPAKEEPQSGTDSFDFGEFSFGDDTEATVTSVADGFNFGQNVMQAPAVPPNENATFDFGDESLFADTTAAAEAEKSVDSLQFGDFLMEELAVPASDITEDQGKDVEGNDELSTVERSEEIQSSATETVPAGRNEKEEEPAPAGLMAPPVTAMAASAPEPVAAPAEDELPPLSIPSRRKQSPLLVALLGLLGLVVVGVVGFMGYNVLTDGKSKNIPVPEAGRITVRSVDASFIKNKELGDLLVISGEALNNFKEPRAAIQLKAMVYDASGQVILNKNAYAGNMLTKEQLAALPLDKIESAMANQFGDSLSNLEVAPGKAIPFTIVIPNAPAGAKDYGVEPAGSTVATGKQQ